MSEKPRARLAIRVVIAVNRWLTAYLWYWVVMLLLAIVIAATFGAPIGVVLLGVVFFTFMIGVGIAFTVLWLDPRKRNRDLRH